MFLYECVLDEFLTSMIEEILNNGQVYNEFSRKLCLPCR